MMTAGNSGFEIDSSSIPNAVRDFAATLQPGMKVLDVGCGLRPYEQFFVPGSYTGVDVSESGRKPADKVADFYFDGLQLPFADETYDAIVCTQVLEHSLEPEKLVSEMRRVLRRGRTGLITVPMTWGEHEVPFDFRRYTSFGFRRLLVDGGFEVAALERVTVGVSAIATLVGSEMQASKSLLPAPSLSRRFVERFSHCWWAVQIRLWRKLYAFPRIYLDNLAIVRRPN